MSELEWTMRPDLRLRWDESGSLMAVTASGDLEQPMAAETLALLELFVLPQTDEEAIVRFLQDHSESGDSERMREALTAVLSDWREAGLLVPVALAVPYRGPRVELDEAALGGLDSPHGGALGADVRYEGGTSD